MQVRGKAASKASERAFSSSRREANIRAGKPMDLLKQRGGKKEIPGCTRMGGLAVAEKGGNLEQGRSPRMATTEWGERGKRPRGIAIIVFVGIEGAKCPKKSEGGLIRHASEWT